MLDKTKLKKIFEHYGELRQVSKLHEEITELNSEIFQYASESIIKLNSTLTADLVEEMADVYVMMSQFLEQDKYRDRIIEIANQKIERQLNRIERGEK